MSPVVVISPVGSPEDEDEDDDDDDDDVVGSSVVIVVPLSVSVLVPVVSVPDESVAPDALIEPPVIVIVETGMSVVDGAVVGSPVDVPSLPTPVGSSGHAVSRRPSAQRVRRWLMAIRPPVRRPFQRSDQKPTQHPVRQNSPSGHGS
jgi:hypothetical protein